MDFVNWLNSIQGKDISGDILGYIKIELGDSSKYNRKTLIDKVKKLCNINNYDIDVGYVIDNLSGLHIDPLDLHKEHIVLTEFDILYNHLGESLRQIPFVYILQRISDKYSLDIKKTVIFPREKTVVFDKLLENIGY